MTPSEAEQNLRRHAGYEQLASDVPELALVLFEFRNGRLLENLDFATEDILKCLAAINTLVNPNAEEAPPHQEARIIPRLVLGAVSSISFDCLDAAIEARDDISRTKLLNAAWMIQCAWTAVVAGDTPNILDYVKLEWQARVGRATARQAARTMGQESNLCPSDTDDRSPESHRPHL